MSRFLRLIGMSAIVLSLAVVSVGATVWASPSQQGTVPLCPPIILILAPTGPFNVCSWLVNMPAAAFPPGGQAAAHEENRIDCEARTGPPPAGQRFLSDCIDFAVQNADGTDVGYLSGSVQLCVANVPGTINAIRRWYSVADLRALGRVTSVGQWTQGGYVTFTDSNGLRCIRGTRIAGTFALFGR